MGEFSIDGFPMLGQMTWVNVFDPPDIGSGCFRGFGRSRASEATTRIPESCLGTWRVDVEWSGLREMIIHDRGIIWNDPDLGIEWPVSAGQAVLSDKDTKHPRFADLPAYFD